MDLSKFTAPKINKLKTLMNLTDDEELVFDMLAKKKSTVEISLALNMSIRTVERRISSIRRKLKEVENEL